MRRLLEMNLNYGDIVYTVANNVGWDIPTSAQIEIIKRHMYFEMQTILRKSLSVKEEFEKPITVSKTTMEMPDNFYMAEEVIFMNANKHKLYSVEMEHEEFALWDPDAFEDELLNFEDFALSYSGRPTRYFSAEDLKYNNVIGYAFIDQKDRPKMVWKPASAGYLKVIYSATLDSEIRESVHPEIMHSFVDMAMSGTTYRILNLLMTNAESEVRIVSLRNSMSVYKSQRDEALKEFIAFVNHNTETPYVTPFNFFGTSEDIYHG
jgi:hypothetical protein